MFQWTPRALSFCRLPISKSWFLDFWSFDTVLRLINLSLNPLLSHIALAIALLPHLPTRHATQRRSNVSVRSHIGRDVADHPEMSSRPRNRYVNETDLFETFLQRLIDTWKNLTYLRRHNDVPIDTKVRLINLTHRRDVITVN